MEWIFQLLLLIGVSLGVSLFTQLLYKKFTDQEALASISKELKELQSEIKSKKDPQEALDSQSKIMNLSSKRFKLTLKPMMISMVFFFITFPLFKGFFNGFILFELPFSLMLTDGTIGWLWTYVILSTIFSPIVKKFLKVNM